ncbi:hypothetical protein MKW92_039162 [Papaver armeniacum]|nr:hypothetical protein MKW92_039162 [Papaver armeniacum]
MFLRELGLGHQVYPDFHFRKLNPGSIFKVIESENDTKPDDVEIKGPELNAKDSK